MRLSFSIVINTLNRAHLLETSLRSLRQLRYPNFEVIVVNGPSIDDSAAVIASYPDVKALDCPEANLAMSRNIGIAAAAGDIVCFLDDDAAPEPNWLDQLESAYAHERVGAVGGFIRDHTGVAYQCRAVVCDRFGEAHNFPSEAEAKARCDRNGWYFLSQTGANSSFRRAALLQIGAFDEHYAYFLDETDVNLRLIEAGWEIRFAEGAEVHHKYAPSAERDARRIPTRLYHPFRSKAYFVCRHAREHKSLGEIFEFLAAHTMEIRRHNRWYLEQRWIDRAHFDRLETDMATGLADGVRAAFGGSPVLLHAARPVAFRRFAPTRVHEDRMRLAFLSQEYPPGAIGGIGVWTHTLARALAAEGHEVSVVTRAREANTVNYEDGVWVHRILPEHRPDRVHPALSELPQTVKDYAYAAHDELLRIHRIRGLDLVSWPIWDLEGAALASSGMIPNVVSLHTSYLMALPSKPDWLQNPAYRASHVDKVIAGERGALARAPYVLANSKAILTDIEATYGVVLDRRRVALAPHGLEDVSASGVPQHAKAGSVLEILFVGRLEPRKGADLLLDALSRILPRYPQLSARFVGDCTLKINGATVKDRFLRRWAGSEWAGRVRFDGVLERRLLMQAYARCDMLVAPSHYESFGLIAVEAMMFGKPVIASRVGGLAEIVVDGETGLLAKPGDRASLVQCIERLIGDAALRRSMGEAGRRRFVEHYTVDIMRSAVEQAFRGIIEAERCGKAAA